MSSSDQIFVEGISCLARVGVPLEERRSPQKLLIDISLQLDLSEAADHDDIESTVNYVDIVELVERTVESNSFSLIEALAGKIASLILAFQEVQRTTVKVRKFPRVLEGRTKSVAVELSRAKTATK